MSLVGLVLVSHSRRLAEGLAELVAQMAPDVPIEAAGGLSGGELGTDFESVASALERADRGAGVVLLYDIGSAQMTAELAVEALDDPVRAYVADAPFVEGSVAAAVAAQGGADLDAVALTASSAAADAEWPLADPASGSEGEPGDAADTGFAAAAESPWPRAQPTADTEAPATAPSPTAPAAAAQEPESSSNSQASAQAPEAWSIPAPEVTPALTSLSTHAQETDMLVAELALHNDVGLHARPAALLARCVAGLTARVTVRFGDRQADAGSVLALMGLGAGSGDRIEVRAAGPDAAEALRRLTELADRGFED